MPANLFIKPAKARFFIETFLKVKLDELRAILPGARILNIGCGVTGRYAEWLSGFDVDGIDVQVAATPQPWRYHQGDAARLPYEDQSFDAAIAIEAFEHIENNHVAMAEAFRVLKPGAKFFITVPSHYTWPFEFGRHGPHYYTRESIRALVESAGFRVISLQDGGGLICYLSCLGKNWVSPIGRRIMGFKLWWPFLNGVCYPLDVLASKLDRFLPVLPANWLITAEKPSRI